MSNRLDDQRSLPAISTTTAEKAFEFDTRADKTWLSPISMSTLQRAVNRKDKKVILNGVDYDITYGIYFESKLSGERSESIKLKRSDGGFAPFGYINVKRIKNFHFEGDDS